MNSHSAPVHLHGSGIMDWPEYAGELRTRKGADCPKTDLCRKPAITTVASRFVAATASAFRQRRERMTTTLLSSIAPVDEAVKRVRNGDVQAFSLIVERYQKPLRAWIAARSPPELDADEIAQAVMVAAYTRLDDYQLNTDMSAWLWTIARFQLRGAITNLTRQRDIRTRHWPIIAYEELIRRCDDESSIDPRLSALNACLNKLGDGARAVLDLHYIQELDANTIAQQTGRTYAAIRKQLCIIRRSLHECISKQDEQVQP